MEHKNLKPSKTIDMQKFQSKTVQSNMDYELINKKKIRKQKEARE